MRRRALLLLTTTALVLVIASGTAMAETQNGLLYYSCNRGILVSEDICATDPTATNPQSALVTDQGNLFDISSDRTTIVYQSNVGYQDLASFVTAPLFDARNYSQWKPVTIQNLSADLKRMTEPRFSPDGKTIYFLGTHVIDPPEGDDPRYYDVPAIYSVPTQGGKATRIPIDWVKSDGTPLGIGSFAVSHDGSKFAINGAGIYTVPVTGGTPTRVSRSTCGGEYSPSFSLDDQMIVYVAFAYSGDSCSGTRHWLVHTTPANNDGTSPGTLLFPEDASNTTKTIKDFDPTYSPDGKSIAFTRWGDGPYDHLAVAPATGGTIKNIAPCSFCVPRWIEKMPNTTITSSPSPTSSPTVSFSFSTDMNDTTFECKLDSGAFESCTSPKKYSSLPVGSHTFEVRAVTSDGILDLTPAKYSWTVDNVPDTNIDSGPLEWPPDYVRSTSATFSFSSPPESGTTTFQCSRDGASFTACSSPKSYSSLSQGNHTFQVRAVNSAGKPDPYPASRTWFVDTVVPKGTIAINGKDTSTKSQSVDLNLLALDPTSPCTNCSGVAFMRFRNENTTTWSDWFDYSSHHSWMLSNGSGTKTVYAQFKDRAENVSAAASDKIKYAP